MHSEVRREAPASGRLGLVGVVLTDALAELRALVPDRAVEVLDCGGGSGTFAVPLAAAGARVSVVDLSADALATLRRRADEAGVADRVVPIAGDVEALAAAVDGAQFDLALAHGVLEAVDHPAAAFAAIAEHLRPGGLLSVLVANPVAGVLARALAGDLDAALRELGELDSFGGPDLVRRWSAAAGLTVISTHGIGVFSDLVPGAALDAPGARAALAALESACATRSPFAEIAARVHVLARRPPD